jgi:hypothetical protein
VGVSSATRSTVGSPYTAAVEEKMMWGTPPFTAEAMSARDFTVLLR